jgi:hypothetical protein
MVPFQVRMYCRGAAAAGGAREALQRREHKQALGAFRLQKCRQPAAGSPPPARRGARRRGWRVRASRAHQVVAVVQAIRHAAVSDALLPLLQLL